MKTGAKAENRFDSDARHYANYLESPEGRLRADLTFATLQEFLPAKSPTKTSFVLDVGGGTASAAVRLARLGFHVTVLDSSPAMVELAQRNIDEAGESKAITVKRGEAADLANIFSVQSFDIVLCHNLLEFVDDPRSVLRGIAPLMRSPSAILSILVRNQAGEVLKAALGSGDLTTADCNLNENFAEESLYGGKVRLFTPDALSKMLEYESLRQIAMRGVRVLADYLPPQISRSAEFERIFALERKLGIRSEFAGVARYLHVMACPATPRMVDA